MNNLGSRNIFQEIDFFISAWKYSFASAANNFGSAANKRDASKKRSCVAYLLSFLFFVTRNRGKYNIICDWVAYHLG